MKAKYHVTLFLLMSCSSLFAHEGILKGIVADSISKNSLAYVSVLLQGENIKQVTTTDDFGKFSFPGLEKGKYQLTFSNLGYERKTISVELNDDEVKTVSITIQLRPNALQLSEVTVSGTKDLGQTMNTINSIDMQLRPTNSAQDLLRLVPGLFIAQHQGGGKAEQLFLRGFDADHGTDFAVFCDGMPVNMVSHAHGQGYADMHFVIPETIEALNVYKGTYTTRFGDFATSGAGEFSTKNHIANSLLKSEYGEYGTYRILTMLNLLGKDKHFFSRKNEDLYIASEYNYNKASYFINHQNYKRLNIFAKYHGMLSDKTSLTISGSYFNSTWNGSGQVPQRAIEQGLISRFGALDPSEGGQTSRGNANVILKTVFGNESVLKNQLYYSYYKFNLFTNFTFFLNDSVNGDGINQNEKGRNLFGYNGTYEINKKVAGKNLKTVFGLGSRMDDGQLSLRHQHQRTILDTVVIGNRFIQNVTTYIDETYQLSEKLFIVGGLRADYFYFNYKSALANQPHLNDSLSGRTAKAKLSPKLNLFYNINDNVQLFARSGYGFHSNDARAVAPNPNQQTLPAALGYEMGSTFKLTPVILVNTVLWGLNLQQELTFSGDEGVVEINGRTQRLGVDLSMRYQISKIVYADMDVNYSHGRFLDLPEGENYIPLAPTVTSVAGLSIKHKNGLNASLRYRYISDRPAIEDNSVVALGYFLMDAVVNYKITHFEFGLRVDNIFNSNWNEAQFETLSRLKGEPVQGVDELCFTPGAPRIIRLSLSYFFGSRQSE
jgi:outer membrane receptor for Fe3+-dicitrate